MATNMKKQTKIPVVYLCSEEFSSYLAVSMASLLDNKNKDTYYCIYVLVSEIYGPTALRPFEKMKETYRDFSITWVEMHDAFNDTEKTINGVGKESLYRLLAAKMLPEVDRCIYLDSDTMVLSDLSEMYAFDTGDAFICGLYPRRILSLWLRDYTNTYGNMARKVMERQMGLVAFDQYIGAGVMIMNLKLIRDENMMPKFLARVQPHSMPKDQDVLNACCYGRIKKLPAKFCIDIHEFDDLDWYAENDEGYDEFSNIQLALLNPVVIHYADKFKPWKMFGLRYERHWWRYAVSLGLFDRLWDDFVSINVGYQAESIPIVSRKSEAEIYQEAYVQFSKGISYRIGRAITFIPRKIYFWFRGLWH